MLDQKGPVRSVDIARALNFAKPSVSIAMKNLCESGYITKKDGQITLTKSGRAVAEMVHERHVVLSNWLIALGVDIDTAHADACKMEHAMSEQSFAAIKKFLQDA